MKYALLTVLALVAALAFADRDRGHGEGPYVVRRISTPSFNTAIFYPACEQDEDDEDECEDGEALPPRKTFSAVIFAQGGSVDASYYSQVATKIAQQGYIVALPNAPRTTFAGQSVQLTNTNITVSTKLLLQQLAGDSTSPLFGRLTADSFALFGHSYGAGVVLVAGSTNGPALCANPANGLAPLCTGYQGFGAGLKAVVVYAASLTNRRFGVVSVVPIFSMLTPTVFIRGNQDGVLTRVDSVNAYNQLQNTTKAFIELEGANHLGINDLQVIPLANPDPIAQPNTNDYSTNKIAKIVTVALQAHLDGSNRASKLIYTRKDLKIAQTNVTFADLH